MPTKFKHLIEEAKADTFKSMEDGELRDFRFRFIQLFERFFHDPATDQIRGMAKGDFLSRYVELRVEMTHRGLPIPGEREIDRLVKDRVVRKGLWSLDVPGLGDIVLAMDYVAITGDYIRDPKEAGAVQVVIKAAKEDRGILYDPEALKTCIAKALEETGKEIQVAWQHGGFFQDHMPVFDLILRPKPTNRISPGDPAAAAPAEPIEKKLTPAQQAEVDAESAVIGESAKTARAKGIHKFEPAKWTHPNGHPRCLICGHEEPIGGICNKTLPKAEADKQFEYWYQTGEWLTKGGAGSGNFGHAGGAGGPGNPGGSAASLGIADVYHGTTRKALESIIADGIKPAQGQHYRKELYYGDRAGAVFVTTSKLEAEDYARLAGRKEKADEIAVIHVRLPAGTKLQVDTEHYGSGKAFYTRQAIKPGSIIGAKIIDVRTRESRTISLKADGRIPDAGDIYVVVLIRNDPDPEGGIAKGGPEDGLEKGGAGSGNFGHEGGAGGQGNPGGSQGTGGGEPRAVDEKWAANLSSAENDAVGSWIGSEYQDIRESRMTGRPSSSPRINRAADELDAMFDKYPNGGAQDKALFRGLSQVPDDAFETLSNKGAGDKIEIDKTIQSWSKTEGIAVGFADGGKSVIFKLPAGRQSTKELDISLRGFKGEDEVIMKTTGFKIASIEKTTYDYKPSWGGNIKEDRLIIHLIESND
jgi:hypothetical protein